MIFIIKRIILPCTKCLLYEYLDIIFHPYDYIINDWNRSKNILKNLIYIDINDCFGELNPTFVEVIS